MSETPRYFVLTSLARQREKATLRDSFKIGVQLQNVGLVQVLDWDDMNQQNRDWWKQSYSFNTLPMLIDTHTHTLFPGHDCIVELKVLYRFAQTQLNNQPQRPAQPVRAAHQQPMHHTQHVHTPAGRPVVSTRRIEPSDQRRHGGNRPHSPRGKNGERVPYTEERNGKLARLYRQPVSTGSDSDHVRFTSHGVRVPGQ